MKTHWHALRVGPGKETVDIIILDSEQMAKAIVFISAADSFVVQTIKRTTKIPLVDTDAISRWFTQADQAESFDWLLSVIVGPIKLVPCRAPCYELEELAE